jgi:hypothetical protein
MTLVAQTIPSPRVFPAATAAIATRGFVELDDRIAGAVGGVAVVRGPSREAAEAAGAHVARRARAVGLCAIEARSTAGAPLWREVASRLGVSSLAGDPADAADTIARAANLRRAMIVAALPPAGSWDRAVAYALSSLVGAPPVVLVATSTDTADDLHADAYEINATLDPLERLRWWTALAESAHLDVPADAVAALDAWWQNARHAPLARAGVGASLGVGPEALATMLALVARAWQAADVAVFGTQPGALEALARAGATRTDGGDGRRLGHDRSRLGEPRRCSGRRRLDGGPRDRGARAHPALRAGPLGARSGR